MFFFPPDPPQDGDSAPQQHLSPPWWQPPEDEFPLLFPIAERLATGENAAIFVREARVYSIGVEVVIDRRMRRGELSERDWQLLQWGGQPFFGGQDPDRVRGLLAQQIDAPVQWVRIIERMAADGVTHALEIGPGKVLAGLGKRISKQIRVLSVGDPAAIERAAEFLSEA